MSSIPNEQKKNSKKSMLIVSGILAAIGVSLFAYLMFFVAPTETMELVKVIAVTDDGCIAETLDGFSVNIGECQAEPGQYVDALVDQKVKDRAAAMNPTS